MERALDRCAGLDVHTKTVTVCVRVPETRGGRARQVRTFATTTAELLLLRDWLEAHRVSHVAMEHTGVSRRPVCYVLEEACACSLANAAQMAQVQGRKTDVHDAVWIAQLLEHGLLRPSFVPPAPIRALRDLTRYRTRHGNRWLRTALIEAALAASVRSTTGAFAARYRRIMPHRGHTKAVAAVAHAMLVTAYHLLARQTTYQDPGSDYDDRRQAERARRRADQALDRQSFWVALEPTA